LLQIQVHHPKTSEEFDAFIPPQWRKDGPGAPASSGGGGGDPSDAVALSAAPSRVISVTIKQPDAVEELKDKFPEADTKKLGRVTETLTKATFTETTVTRVTDNRLAPPSIQVRRNAFHRSIPFFSD
jgi:protein scribble